MGVHDPSVIATHEALSLLQIPETHLLQLIPGHFTQLGGEGILEPDDIGFTMKKAQTLDYIVTLLALTTLIHILDFSMATSHLHLKWYAHLLSICFRKALVVSVNKGDCLSSACK
jgi:hypothetical protein